MFQYIKRVIIFVVGITIILFGILLLVLPGPGLLIIAGGLVVLAIEFIWARKILKKMKKQAREAEKKIRNYWR